MNIVLTGSTGLVGRSLLPNLEQSGHQITRLIRSPSTSNDTIMLWDPAAEDILDEKRLEGAEAVIHLAGENIADGRWTPEKKANIRNSRVQGTGLIARTLASLEKKPRVLISASAIGYYGSPGDKELTEDADVGHGFLAGVCRDWEAATESAQECGIRVIHLRIGIVLSTEGGALAKMLPVFKMGMGGKVGNGKQYMSWITCEELSSIVQFLLDHEEVEGPVNAVSPNPVTNSEFSKALGKALSKPSFLPLPALAAHIMFGEMADDLLLSSTRVLPRKLLDAGYTFRHGELDDALRTVLRD